MLGSLFFVGCENAFTENKSKAIEIFILNNVIGDFRMFKLCNLSTTAYNTIPVWANEMALYTNFPLLSGL